MVSIAPVWIVDPGPAPVGNPPVVEQPRSTTVDRWMRDLLISQVRPGGLGGDEGSTSDLCWLEDYRRRQLRWTANATQLDLVVTAKANGAEYHRRMTDSDIAVVAGEVQRLRGITEGEPSFHLLSGCRSLLFGV